MRATTGGKKRTRLPSPLLQDPEKLLVARYRAGLRAGQVAEKAGITLSSYSLFENGKRSPTAQTLQRIAEALGVTVEQIEAKHYVARASRK